MERICAPAEQIFGFVRSYVGAGSQIRSFLAFEGGSALSLMAKHFKHRTLNATLALLVIICMGGPGCGTIANLRREKPPDFYGGVAKDLSTIDEGLQKMGRSCASCISPYFGEGGSVLGGLGLVAVGFTDLPLSLIGDTVTLPYVAVKQPDEGGSFPIRRIPAVDDKKRLRAQSEALARTRLADEPAVQQASIPRHQWPDSIRRLDPQGVRFDRHGIWIITSCDSVDSMYGLFVTTQELDKDALAEVFRGLEYRRRSDGIYIWTNSKDGLER